jgi:nuclear pore complex protein Nup62
VSASQLSRPAPAATSSLFGAKPASTPTTTTAAPSAPTDSVAGKSGGFAAVPAPAAAGSSSTPASTGAAAASVPAEPVPSLLRGKTMDDIVNTWSRELDTQVGEFRRQAGEVREWDRVLIENGKQVRRNLLRPRFKKASG